jgi:hypothetical protein
VLRGRQDPDSRHQQEQQQHQDPEADAHAACRGVDGHGVVSGLGGLVRPRTEFYTARGAEGVLVGLVGTARGTLHHQFFLPEAGPSESGPPFG